MNDRFATAVNMFEVQLQLCHSYFVHKYTHNFYKIVRNIDHLIQHGDSSMMNLKLDIDILQHSYNPYPYFLIKSLQSGGNTQKMSGKDLLIQEIKILVKNQLMTAQIKNCLKKYTFLFSFMKHQYKKLNDSGFNKRELKGFFKFIKLLTNKIYGNANEDFRKMAKCDFN